MSKFNVGDMVKVLKMPSDCVGSFPKDMVGKTIRISNNDSIGRYCVNDNKWECNFLESDLELVKELREGDKVKAVIPLDSDVWEYDEKVGIIKKIDSDYERPISVLFDKKNNLPNNPQFFDKDELEKLR